jgi:hypothetical protein
MCHHKLIFYAFRYIHNRVEEMSNIILKLIGKFLHDVFFTRDIANMDFRKLEITLLAAKIHTLARRYNSCVSKYLIRSENVAFVSHVLEQDTSP